MFSNWRPYSRQYVSRYVIYMISGDLRLLEGYHDVIQLTCLLIVSTLIKCENHFQRQRNQNSILPRHLGYLACNVSDKSFLPPSLE